MYRSKCDKFLKMMVDYPFKSSSTLSILLPLSQVCYHFFDKVYLSKKQRSTLLELHVIIKRELSSCSYRQMAMEDPEPWLKIPGPYKIRLGTESA